MFQSATHKKVTINVAGEKTRVDFRAPRLMLDLRAPWTDYLCLSPGKSDHLAQCCVNGVDVMNHGIVYVSPGIFQGKSTW